MQPERRPAYPAQPISPNEVLDIKAETLPDEVYVAVNGLIAENLHGTYAEVSVRALMGRLRELGLDEKEIKLRGWTRIGTIYERLGWKVSYHYPSFDSDSDYDPYYSFDTQGPRSW